MMGFEGNYFMRGGKCVIRSQKVKTVRPYHQPYRKHWLGIVVIILLSC